MNKYACFMNGGESYEKICSVMYGALPVGNADGMR